MLLKINSYVNNDIKSLLISLKYIKINNLIFVILI